MVPVDLGKALAPRQVGLNGEKTRERTSDRRTSRRVAEGGWGGGSWHLELWEAEDLLQGHSCLQ